MNQKNLMKNNKNKFNSLQIKNNLLMINIITNNKKI